MRNTFVTLFINLLLANKKHCLFMLVHSALTNVKKVMLMTFEFNNALVNI